MKKDNIVHDIKTVGVVVGLALTLNSCGDKPLSEEQKNTITAKADSASKVNKDYSTAVNVIDFAKPQIDKYHNANKKIVKKYASSYINHEIKDAKLRDFMINLIKQEGVLEHYENVCEDNNLDTDNSTGSSNDGNMAYIRKNQRWFNDLMLYLSDKYDDRQLLNSEFFKIINYASVKDMFERNTKQIEKLKSAESIASKIKHDVYSANWEKYENEVRYSKQR